MNVVKLKPAIIVTLWGGKRLFSYGKESNEDHISESWELSFQKEHPSIIASGPDAGKALYEVATASDIGAKAASFPFFPTLIKFIDSAQFLSVQVHPSDEYALAHEGMLGKTEMWYILEAEEGAGIYLGFRRDTTAEEVRERIANGTIEEILNFIPVKAGESYFIPSGTVHAIGAGITVIETQQNSTLTYRLYDYGRKGTDGKLRELHVEKALKVLNFKAFEPVRFELPLVGECAYFRSTVREIHEGTLTASPGSFLAISILSGQGKIDDIPFQKGDSFFLPASASTSIRGEGEIFLTEVPA